MSFERNPGIPLDLNLIKWIRINRSAVERRAQTLTKRRSIKKDWQAAWLLKAISCIDLTTLAGDDTFGNVKTLEDGADTAEKEQLSQLAARQQKFINNLENALIRIKNGTYGICVDTGKLISKERLRAVPHTMHSIEAKLGKKP